MRALLTIACFETLAVGGYAANMLVTAFGTEEDVDKAVYLVLATMSMLALTLWAHAQRRAARERLRAAGADLMSSCLSVMPILLQFVQSERLSLESGAVASSLDGRGDDGASDFEAEAMRLYQETAQARRLAFSIAALAVGVAFLVVSVRALARPPSAPGPPAVGPRPRPPLRPPPPPLPQLLAASPPVSPPPSPPPRRPPARPPSLSPRPRPSHPPPHTHSASSTASSAGASSFSTVPT